MEFYCDAVDRSIAEGKTKENCDETFREMFRAVGYDKNDRKLLAEFLANGKPRFLDDDGVLPYNADAVKFAERFKAVLDKTKEYRAKLPKAYGDIVADTILGTLKTVDQIFDVDDLPRIDADLCDKISAAAKNVDVEKLLSKPSDKVRSAKSLSKSLDRFQRDASEKFAAEFLKPNDSDLMVTIKQRLFMSLALAQGEAKTDSLAEEIDEHYDDLVEKYGMEDLLGAIAPGLERDEM